MQCPILFVVFNHDEFEFDLDYVADIAHCKALMPYHVQCLPQIPNLVTIKFTMIKTTNKQGILELYTQQHIEGNIVRQKLSRL